MILKVFYLHLYLWRLDGVFGDVDEVKTVSVVEGDSVTLHTDTKLQREDVMEWMFGVQSPDESIAELNTEANMTSFINERFKMYLQLHNQTGDLTITNIRTEHTGLYKVEISRIPSSFSKQFKVTVCARLPVPVISRDSPQCSSSSERSSRSKCVLVCSVMNVTHATLSWYKGNSLFSSISASDLNIRLSLPLEVEYQDNNTYSCVLNNSISNQTQHLNIIDVCQPCSGLTSDHQVLISCAAAGSLMIVVSVLIFWMCRKHRHTDQQERVQTVEEEITYAEPTFCKRQTHKPRAPADDEVMYAGIATR